MLNLSLITFVELLTIIKGYSALLYFTIRKPLTFMKNAFYSTWKYIFVFQIFIFFNYHSSPTFFTQSWAQISKYTFFELFGNHFQFKDSQAINLWVKNISEHISKQKGRLVPGLVCICCSVWVQFKKIELYFLWIVDNPHTNYLIHKRVLCLQ